MPAEFSDERRAELEDAIREWRAGHVTDHRDAELSAVIVGWRDHLTRPHVEEE